MFTYLCRARGAAARQLCGVRGSGRGATGPTEPKLLKINVFYVLRAPPFVFPIDMLVTVPCNRSITVNILTIIVTISLL
ncbi:unnamed protein product [Colias eurytheme]|nr:unnamed protein product [Colias eurytheme]